MKRTNFLSEKAILMHTSSEVQGPKTQLLYSKKSPFCSSLSNRDLAFGDSFKGSVRIWDRIDCVPCSWTVALAREILKVWDTRQIRSTEIRKHVLIICSERTSATEGVIIEVPTEE